MFLFDGVGQVAFPFVYLVAKVQNIFALSASELLRYYKKMRMCWGNFLSCLWKLGVLLVFSSRIVDISVSLG